MKTYEAMFLLDSTLSSDWASAEAEVKRILERAQAKVLGLKNWDERKLATPVRGHKRGLYALSFFEAPPEKIEGIERDVHLSEKAIRVLILRREKLTPESIEKALTAPPPPKASFRGQDEWSPRPPMGDRDDRGPARDTGAPIEEAPIDVLEA